MLFNPILPQALLRIRLNLDSNRCSRPPCNNNSLSNCSINKCSSNEKLSTIDSKAAAATNVPTTAAVDPPRVLHANEVLPRKRNLQTISQTIVKSKWPVYPRAIVEYYGATIELATKT